MTAGDRATVCIRERGVRLAREGAGLSGRVLDIKFLGDVARLEVGIEGFDQALKVRVGEGDGWVRGAEVRAQIDPARVLVFPTESQK
jgi:iron(III) transport system ATP-binding protein